MTELSAALKHLKHLLPALAVFGLMTISSGPAQTQSLPPNAAGVAMGHWHMNSRDIEANKKILVAMGGTAIKNGNFEIVRFPGVVVFLNRGPGAAPPTGGSAGTVVNHVGFTVPNVKDAMAKWTAAGIKVDPGRNRDDQINVTTPDGLRFEILEDKTQTVPIRSDHVHFMVPESEIPKMAAWYVKNFGGVAAMRNGNPVVNIPGIQLRFLKSDAPQTPTTGHVLDHIGFDVKNLEAFTKKLEANGVPMDRAYSRDSHTGSAIAFTHDPWGTSIELNERATTLGTAHSDSTTTE